MTDWMMIAQSISSINIQSKREVRIRLGFCGSIYCFGLIQENIPADEQTLFFVSRSIEPVQCSSCSKVTFTEIWLIFKVIGRREISGHGPFPDNSSNLIDLLPKTPTPLVNYNLDQNSIYSSLNRRPNDDPHQEDCPDFFEDTGDECSPEDLDYDTDDDWIDNVYKPGREFYDDISDCMVGPNYMFNSLPKAPHRTYWSTQFDDEYSDAETNDVIEWPDGPWVEDDPDDFDPDEY